MSKTIKRFTVANLARELNLDPRVARRRLRAHVAKNASLPDMIDNELMTRKNARWEWRANKTNVAAIRAIIMTSDDDADAPDAAPDTDA